MRIYASVCAGRPAPLSGSSPVLKCKPEVRECLPDTVLSAGAFLHGGDCHAVVLDPESAAGPVERSSGAVWHFGACLALRQPVGHAGRGYDESLGGIRDKYDDLLIRFERGIPVSVRGRQGRRRQPVADFYAHHMAIHFQDHVSGDDDVDYLQLSGV